MQVAIRDASLYQAGYASAVEGLLDLGLAAIELAIDRDGYVRSLEDELQLNLTDPAHRNALEEQMERHGVRVCTLLCSQDFHHPEEREAHVHWVTQAAQVAEILGIPSLRVDSIMTGQAELPLPERVRIFAEGLREVLRGTPDSTVELGIENHGPQGNDPEWMLAVLGEVDNPRVGVTLDVGNWYWFGHPLSRVYQIYRELGPHVKATHVKNIAYPEELRETQREVGYEYGRYCCPLDEGDLEMAKVVAILREAGYDGPLTIEDESIGKVAESKRREVLKRDAEHLRAVLTG
ncbi:MAG: sugar phosphate isomerase/epimerase family protein [Armatimonadota bacterium]